ncbi:MAG: hypothetical protein A4E62_03043 [Syntrophorhabdus sp. PtaU1.Bin002]|nr:MAG: hypothetical protein A4E62_03043 [Syntrophorhabdus sp. PtaU1.Bin002]
MEKIKIGVSRCILGEKVRYDGGHQHDRYITDTLGRYFEYIPVCPEVEYGLPVPREPMHLTGNPSTPRLITIKTGIDHTDGMLTWADQRLKELQNEDLCGFIFKSKSPSSGMQRVKVYASTGTGMPIHKGVGIFARVFMDRFPLLPVEDDGRLHDPILRENFVERVFAYRSWQTLMEGDKSIGSLVDFHTNHKLLLMSHSPKHYSALGKLVAGAKGYKGDLYGEYITTMMDGLRLIATAQKQINVLQHMLGYFKSLIAADEKQEMLDIIEKYYRGLVPLIVPIALFTHYVRKFDIPYLKRQSYLNPHPMELMLRNHV